MNTNVENADENEYLKHEHSKKSFMKAVSEKLFQFGSFLDDGAESIRRKIFDNMTISDRVSRLGEKLYQASKDADDSLEGFRNDVFEMTGTAILFGDLISHRLHQLF